MTMHDLTVELWMFSHWVRRVELHPHQGRVQLWAKVIEFMNALRTACPTAHVPCGMTIRPEGATCRAEIRWRTPHEVIYVNLVADRDYAVYERTPSNHFISDDYRNLRFDPNDIPPVLRLQLESRPTS